MDAPLAFVDRQAIFDRDLRVRAYELLYRDSFEIGLDNLVGDLPVYANLTADFLHGQYAVPFGPERLILEVLLVDD